MSNWDQIRTLARKFHAEVCAFGDDPTAPGESAEGLLARAARVTGIRTKGYIREHPLLHGALARVERNTILFDNTVDRWLAFYHQAHEHAHILLGHGERCCVAADIDGEAAEDKLPIGVHRVEGYSPHERLECEANVFAREFLLPSDVLRKWFIEDGLNAEAIAVRVGDSPEMTDMVCHQLARALLTPAAQSDEKAKGDQSLSLDRSQRKAAEAPEGPLLITAGPGTGKTRTLAGRVVHLLGRGVSAEAILVLTFSNKAADELRDRVKIAVPAQSPAIRIETFHSFGLDLLRKYGAKIGLPDDPPVLDIVDALMMLEGCLVQLELDHYQNLYEPSLFLSGILRAISRAKDENVNPAQYRKYADAMLASGVDETAAGKAAEVARVYNFYQGHLTGKGQLDFGDLICRSIELLQNHLQVREEVRGIYQHVLVDEYQDVNRASGLLLKEIVGEGKGLWAVGDIRQSIHRWRGATTANIRLFSTDYPAAKAPLPLEMNYRSQPVIVDAFSELVPQMQAKTEIPFTPWLKNRIDEGGSFRYEVAVDLKAEAQGIAREIKQNVKGLISYREQAVICRSHTSLARIARHLEEEGVPVLYLGDFFERPEVRDMLSLLSLTCERSGRGLLRVARFDEYQVPLSDVQALRSTANDRDRPFPAALDLAGEAEGITDKGKEKLTLIAAHIDGLGYGRSAWKTLTRYLFVRSNYLRTLLTNDSVAGQQRRLAIYQLLQFVHSQRERRSEPHMDPKRFLLRYIRRLEVYGEERQLRQVPAWADGIDAVRILTIHASKGLEFRAVFLPVLAKTYLPVKGSRETCPPPQGMTQEQDGWRLEEEECLFFVAMSRAQDHLYLSRALRYGLVNRNPSEFLSKIRRRLPRAVDAQPTWLRDDSIAEVSSEMGTAPSSGRPVFEERALQVYMKCPRKYFYEFVIGLSATRDDSAYLRFHNCVYGVVRWLQSARAAGNLPSNEEALAYLAEVWKARGPGDHPYGAVYWQFASAMVLNAVQRQKLPGWRPAETEHEVRLASGNVKVVIDNAERAENGESSVVVQRFRTGRQTKSEEENVLYGLYRSAAQEAFPRSHVVLQTLYLSTNQTRDIELTDKQCAARLNKYSAAISGITEKRFDPTPSEHECPRCPHFFICPMAEDS